MSLEICETITPEKLKLKNSRFFKDRIRLTIDPDAECKFIRVSDDLYYKQQKYYFPLFEKIIFIKASKDNQSKDLPMIFNGTFIQEDEIGMISSVIKEKYEKENKKYNEYKKALDKEISEIIGSLNSEIANQKKFLKKDYLTKHQYNSNIKTLINAYSDIITIKLGNDINLRNDDRSLVNKFYSNMITGLGSNNINKDILININESDDKDAGHDEALDKADSNKNLNQESDLSS